MNLACTLELLAQCNYKCRLLVTVSSYILITALGLVLVSGGGVRLACVRLFSRRVMSWAMDRLLGTGEVWGQLNGLVGLVGVGELAVTLVVVSSCRIMLSGRLAANRPAVIPLNFRSSSARVLRGFVLIIAVCIIWIGVVWVVLCIVHLIDRGSGACEVRFRWLRRLRGLRFEIVECSCVGLRWRTAIGF